MRRILVLGATLGSLTASCASEVVLEPDKVSISENEALVNESLQKEDIQWVYVEKKDIELNQLTQDLLKTEEKKETPPENKSYFQNILNMISDFAFEPFQTKITWVNFISGIGNYK